MTKDLPNICNICKNCRHNRPLTQEERLDHLQEQINDLKTNLFNYHRALENWLDIDLIETTQRHLHENISNCIEDKTEFRKRTHLE